MPKEKKTGGKVKPHYYPGEDRPKPRVKGVKNPTKLRASITPGTVLILLAGRFRGKKVVFLKQLSSGLLLVTGPFSVNGVPIKRVNQAYAIATSTKIPLPTLPVDIDDAYFARNNSKKARSEEEAFYAQSKGNTFVTEARKADQVKVDAVLLPEVEKVDMLAAYLQTKFSLKKGDKPHEMKF